MALIRTAKQNEVEQILPLMKAFYETEALQFDEATAQDAVVGLIRESAFGTVLVAEAEDALVGYLALTFGYSLEYGGRDAFIDEVYVDRSHRRAGVGRQLLDRALEICAAEQVRALHLEVEEGNLPARALYGRGGFEEHERILMTQRLGGAGAAPAP